MCNKKPWCHLVIIHNRSVSLSLFNTHYITFSRYLQSQDLVTGFSSFWLCVCVCVRARCSLKVKIAQLQRDLEALLKHDVIPKLPSEALHDADVFRRARLYTEEVDVLLRSHEPQLRVLFEFYAEGDEDIEGHLQVTDGDFDRDFDRDLTEI